jgi:tetratricopeptide (TPR) repeat protein
VLVAGGVGVTPQALVPEVYLPERKGSLQVEMLATARRHGMVSYQLAPRFDDLLREIASGTPVIVLQNLGLGEGWHYAVAIGYDYEAGMLILRSGTNERAEMPFGVHELFWARSGYWAMTVSPPGRTPVTAQEERWVSALAAFERSAQPQAARTAYSAALERWPGSVPALVGLANAHHRLKELPQAEAALRRAEKLAPESVIVLNNLAQTLSDQGRDGEALPVIDRAAKLGGPFAATVQETRKSIQQKLDKKS